MLGGEKTVKNDGLANSDFVMGFFEIFSYKRTFLAFWFL